MNFKNIRDKITCNEKEKLKLYNEGYLTYIQYQLEHSIFSCEDLLLHFEIIAILSRSKNKNIKKEIYNMHELLFKILHNIINQNKTIKDVVSFEDFKMHIDQKTKHQVYDDLSNEENEEEEEKAFSWRENMNKSIQKIRKIENIDLQQNGIAFSAATPHISEQQQEIPIENSGNRLRLLENNIRNDLNENTHVVFNEVNNNVEIRRNLNSSNILNYTNEGGQNFERERLEILGISEHYERNGAHANRQNNTITENISNEVGVNTHYIDDTRNREDILRLPIELRLENNFPLISNSMSTQIEQPQQSMGETSGSPNVNNSAFLLIDALSSRLNIINNDNTVDSSNFNHQNNATNQTSENIENRIWENNVNAETSNTISEFQNVINTISGINESSNMDIIAFQSIRSTSNSPTNDTEISNAINRNTLDNEFTLDSNNRLNEFHDIDQNNGIVQRYTIHNRPASENYMINENSYQIQTQNNEINATVSINNNVLNNDDDFGNEMAANENNDLANALPNEESSNQANMRYRNIENVLNHIIMQSPDQDLQSTNQSSPHLDEINIIEATISENFIYDNEQIDYNSSDEQAQNDDAPIINADNILQNVQNEREEHFTVPNNRNNNLLRRSNELSIDLNRSRNNFVTSNNANTTNISYNNLQASTTQSSLYNTTDTNFSSTSINDYSISDNESMNDDLSPRQVNSNFQRAINRPIYEEQTSNIFAADNQEESPNTLYINENYEIVKNLHSHRDSLKTLFESGSNDSKISVNDNDPSNENLSSAIQSKDINESEMKRKNHSKFFNLYNAENKYKNNNDKSNTTNEHEINDHNDSIISLINRNNLSLENHNNMLIQPYNMDKIQEGLTNFENGRYNFLQSLNKNYNSAIFKDLIIKNESLNDLKNNIFCLLMQKNNLSNERKLQIMHVLNNQNIFLNLIAFRSKMQSYTFNYFYNKPICNVFESYLRGNNTLALDTMQGNKYEMKNNDFDNIQTCKQNFVGFKDQNYIKSNAIKNPIVIGHVDEMFTEIFDQKHILNNRINKDDILSVSTLSDYTNNNTNDLNNRILMSFINKYKDLEKSNQNNDLNYYTHIINVITNQKQITDSNIYKENQNNYFFEDKYFLNIIRSCNTIFAKAGKINEKIIHYYFWLLQQNIFTLKDKNVEKLCKMQIIFFLYQACNLKNVYKHLRSVAILQEIEYNEINIDLFAKLLDKNTKNLINIRQILERYNNFDNDSTNKRKSEGRCLNMNKNYNNIINRKFPTYKKDMNNCELNKNERQNFYNDNFSSDDLAHNKHIMLDKNNNYTNESKNQKLNKNMDNNYKISIIKLYIKWISLNETKKEKHELFAFQKISELLFVSKCESLILLGKILNNNINLQRYSNKIGTLKKVIEIFEEMFWKNENLMPAIFCLASLVDKCEDNRKTICAKGIFSRIFEHYKIKIKQKIFDTEFVMCLLFFRGITRSIKFIRADLVEYPIVELCLLTLKQIKTNKNSFDYTIMQIVENYSFDANNEQSCFSYSFVVIKQTLAILSNLVLEYGNYKEKFMNKQGLKIVKAIGKKKNLEYDQLFILKNFIYESNWSVKEEFINLFTRNKRQNKKINVERIIKLESCNNKIMNRIHNFNNNSGFLNEKNVRIIEEIDNKKNDKKNKKDNVYAKSVNKDLIDHNKNNVTIKGKNIKIIHKNTCKKQNDDFTKTCIDRITYYKNNNQYFINSETRTNFFSRILKKYGNVNFNERTNKSIRSLKTLKELFNLLRNFVCATYEENLIFFDSFPNLLENTILVLIKINKGEVFMEKNEALKQILYVLVNLCASGTFFRKLFLEDLILEQIWIITKNKNKKIIIALIWLIINLSWNDGLDYGLAVKKIKKFGFKDWLKEVRGINAVINDKVITALENMED
ncbi:hypothetical protein COBT_001559 [Conglomerata obtusa]